VRAASTTGAQGTLRAAGCRTLNSVDTVPFVDRLILASDLRQMGADTRTYRRACERGQLVRIHRGVYVSASVWATLDPSERYLTHIVGALRASRTVSPISHSSAAALWGVPLIGLPPPVVHVLGPASGGTRTENGFRRHGTLHRDLDIVEHGGVLVTSLPRTLAELAASASFRDAVVALDWALKPSTGRSLKPSVSRGDVVAAADRLGFARGRRRLERALSFANGKSGSPGESVSRVTMLELGFPAPELQADFFDVHGFVGTVDFWWPEQNLIGEFDGVAKYIRQEFTQGKSAAEVVVEEKNRENRLRAADKGHGMTRWDWAIAISPSLLFDRLAGAGLRSTRR
jgi:predicted transcriptional regulator of viral defense system